MLSGAGAQPTSSRLATEYKPVVAQFSPIVSVLPTPEPVVDVIYETQPTKEVTKKRPEIRVPSTNPKSESRVKQKPSSVVHPEPHASNVLFGQASYYCCTHGYSSSDHVAAAGPKLRRALGHWRGRLIVLSFGGHSMAVRLVDWCGCGGKGSNRIIDLHPGVFAAFRDLSYGVMRVKVLW